MQDRDNERGKGQGPGRFSRFSRTASFWILIVLIPLLIINVFNPRRENAAELPYMPDFRQQLDAGNIQEVKIIEGQKIEGTLRVPISRDNRTVREFRTHLPIANSEAILADRAHVNLAFRRALRQAAILDAAGIALVPSGRGGAAQPVRGNGGELVERRA